MKFISETVFDSKLLLQCAHIRRWLVCMSTSNNGSNVEPSGLSWFIAIGGGGAKKLLGGGGGNGGGAPRPM